MNQSIAERCLCRAVYRTAHGLPSSLWQGMRLGWRLLNTPLPYTCVRPQREGAAQPVRRPGVPRYVVSSWFLWDSYRATTETPEESLHFATAIEADRAFYLTRSIMFPLAHQSVAGATGDHAATHAACVTADQFGHRIALIAHSHPGFGASATHPSSTDHATHARFEQGGFPVIGCIFSRDGFARFFSHRRCFTVEVFGSGISKEGDRVFKLDTSEAFSVSDRAAACAG